MRTLLLIFACKRPKFADTGEMGFKKTVKLCRRPLWMAPQLYSIWRMRWLTLKVNVQVVSWASHLVRCYGGRSSHCCDSSAKVYHLVRCYGGRGGSPITMFLSKFQRFTDMTQTFQILSHRLQGIYYYMVLTTNQILLVLSKTINKACMTMFGNTLFGH